MQPLEELVLGNSTLQNSANAELSPTMPSERGRVRIVNNNVVTDHGDPLRGEHLVFGTEAGDTDTDSTILYDRAFWHTLRDDYHLNTIRLLLSRPPQNWNGDLGMNCEPPVYRCYPLDYVHRGHPQADGKTTLEIIDDIVDLAGEMEMYIIIDYHPVFGYDLADAASWWARVAPRYADRTHVIYEVANEPYPNTNYPSDAIDFQEIIYQELRRVAPDTHLILWSFPFTSAEIGNTVEQALQVNYQNASIGYHPYGPYDAIDLTNLRNQYPIIATEIGGNRVDMTIAAEAINVSWIWLDGAGLKPGLENATDTYTPVDITWPADPHAGDPLPTATPTNTPTQISTPTLTPALTPTQPVVATATPTLTPILPQSDCGPLVQEAENSLLSGNWTIGYDGNASSNAYIYMPDATNQIRAANNPTNRVNRHQASFCFRITDAGTYRIRGWVYAADRQSDSFFVTIDGQPSDGHIWDIPIGGSYDADYVSSRGGEDPIEVVLAEGDHVVDIFARENGARLDRVALEWIDDGGLEPTPTLTPMPTPTPLPSCGALDQEAEDGTLWGNMQVGFDANARRSAYVASASTSTRIVNAASAANPKHRVDYCLTINQPGEYRMLAQAHAAGDSSNSFFVQINNVAQNEILWDVYPADGTYNTSYVKNRGSDGPATFFFEAGDHTISFILRENGTRLDWFSLQPAPATSAATNAEGAYDQERGINNGISSGTSSGTNSGINTSVAGSAAMEHRLFLPFTME